MHLLAVLDFTAVPVSTPNECTYVEFGRFPQNYTKADLTDRFFSRSMLKVMSLRSTPILLRVSKIL